MEGSTSAVCTLSQTFVVPSLNVFALEEWVSPFAKNSFASLGDLTTNQQL